MVLPYEAWQYMYSIFGGIEIRRFTTIARNPEIEIYYQKVTLIIVEERALFTTLVLQASKKETLSDLMGRVNKIIEEYRIVPSSYLSK